MKYIRTKDGIYEVEDFFKPLENDMVYIPNEGLNKILNQADAIEELCDEFIGILPNEKPYFQLYKQLHTFEDIKNNYLNILKTEPKVECYGAIWTDKGLIYVAKMNEKGELELL